MDDTDSQLHQQDTMPATAKQSPWHPACGKEFPAGDKTGHCSGCCQTFYGLSAFELHRQGEHGGGRHCLDPAAAGGLWWLDDRERWHHGERLTPEQIASFADRRGGAE